MSSYRLQHTPAAAVTSYTVWQGQQQIGEIRAHGLHASALYLGERGLWLQHDDGAAVVAQGGSWFARFLAEIKFSRSWSLHGDGRVLACARRRWHWRPARDVLLLSPAPAETPWVAASSGLLAREMRIAQGPHQAGQLRLCGILNDRVELDWPGLDPARAALFMYAMHRAYAPSNSGGSEGEGD